MSASLKEVLVVGFGAVGAIYSLILKRSGLARVSAVARGNFDLVNNEGMNYESQKYGRIPGWRPDRLFRSVAEAAAPGGPSYDYVVVTTKAIPDLVTTPEVLSPLLSSAYRDHHRPPTYVLLQNGLNVEKNLYNAIKKLGEHPSIISSAVYIGTNLTTPNVVEHSHFDRLSIGVYRGGDFATTFNSPDESALLEDFGNLVIKGGSEATIVPEIQRVKFEKNFWNVAFSSFATLTNHALPALFRPPPPDGASSYSPYVFPATAKLIEEYTIPVLKAVLVELLSLARALGFPDSPEGIPSSAIDGVLERTKALHVSPMSTHKPSMLLDAQRGQPIEVEVIFGEVVRMAKERGVDVPRVELMYALLLVIQNQILAKNSVA